MNDSAQRAPRHVWDVVPKKEAKPKERHGPEPPWFIPPPDPKPEDLGPGACCRLLEPAGVLVSRAQTVVKGGLVAIAVQNQ